MKKKYIKISEEQLKLIVRDSVSKYLTEENIGNQNPRIEEDVPYYGDLIKGFDDEYIKNRISEGLITTYPIDKTINIVCKQFNLQPHQIQKQEVEDNGNTITLLSVVLPMSISKNIIGEIKNTMRTCGYFNIGKFTVIPNNNKFGVLNFEPKFTKDISSKVREKCKYLYHSTSSTMDSKR